MEQFEQVNDDEYRWLMAVMNQNKDKSFVNRILNPQNSPVLKHDGGIATHRMAWTEADGRYFAFPTVLLEGNGQLKDYGNSAWDAVRKTGNYIEFKNPQEADFFSKRYKGAWGGKMNRPPQ